MADIFICYKREDRKKAELLSRKLIMSGWTVWWDHELLGGEDYDVIIGRELSQAKAVLVIWSTASVQSRNVKDEANKALKREVLVPVSFDNTEPPLGFGMTHVIIFENPSKISAEEYDKLYESVKNKAGLPGLVPAVISGGDKKKSMPIGLIVGIVAALAIIAFLVFRSRGNNSSSNEQKSLADTSSVTHTHGGEAMPQQPGGSDAEAGNQGQPPETLTVEQDVNNYFNGRRAIESSLPGDSIIYYRIKEITANAITLNIDYSYNAQHGGTVYLGAWLWKVTKENQAGGYTPTQLTSPSGNTDITITMSGLTGPYTSDYILVFISEPGKGPFTHRIFNYRHDWNP